MRVEPKRKRVQFFETSWKEVRDPAATDPGGSSRRDRLTVGIVGAAIVVILIIVLVYLPTSHPAGAEVLVQSGTAMQVPQGSAWEIGKGGSLQGSFVVSNGTAEVCFADYDMFDYAVSHNLGFDQCPSNATYSSGFVSSGELSGSFGAGYVDIQTFVPASWTEGQPRPNVVWTSAAEVVPG